MTDEQLIERVALAISRADNEKIPDGVADGFDHEEISDWSVYLAQAAIEAYRSALPSTQADDEVRGALELTTRALDIVNETMLEKGFRQARPRFR